MSLRTRIIAVLSVVYILAILTAGCGNKSTEQTKLDQTKSEATGVIEDKSVGSNIIQQTIEDKVNNALTSTTASTSTATPTPAINNTKEDNANQTTKSNGTIQPSKDISILKGKTICIDPGHQSRAIYEQEPIAPGSTITKDKMSSGTEGVVTKVAEYKLNMDVSNKLKGQLEKYGAKVVMTRENNDSYTGCIERAKMANESKADLVLRIHADGDSSATTKGISMLYPGNKYISDTGVVNKSKLAASKVLQGIIARTNAVSRGIVARDDLTGFNWSTVPVILVEMGFMTNPDEDRLLNTTEYQDKIVLGLIDGLVAYLIEVK